MTTNLPQNLQKRLAKLRQVLKQKKLDAFLISTQENRYYLTGWQGDSESGYLLITPTKAFIFTDSRYTEEVTNKVQAFELVEFKSNFFEFLATFLEKEKLFHVGFEARSLSVFAYEALKGFSKQILFSPQEYLVEDLRAVKDELEIDLLRRSSQIAAESFAFAREIARPGMQEKELAWEIEKFMRASGAEKNAWDPFIVASGPNSSIVHYAAGNRELQKGDMVQLDWGCVYEGYFCDISRTLFLGTPSSKQAEVYTLVLGAQKAGLEKIKLGALTKEIDKASQDFLEGKTNFAFAHSVGHGVGLEVHELPRVNSVSETKIEKGQVFTVEPGIYEPGWGGVRIEDTILVTETGYELLTVAPSSLESSIVKN